MSRPPERPSEILARGTFAQPPKMLGREQPHGTYVMVTPEYERPREPPPRRYLACFERGSLRFDARNSAEARERARECKWGADVALYELVPVPQPDWPAPRPNAGMATARPLNKLAHSRRLRMLPLEGSATGSWRDYLREGPR
jgi:hypothetical protein